MLYDVDLVIIGSGPAGLTSALYSARAGLKTVVFEESKLGGAIVDAELVENFPSYPNGISGSELSGNLLSQVMEYGVELKLETVTGIELPKMEVKRIHTTKAVYSSKTLIIAGGARPKKLGIPGEEKYEGKGLSYCAYCDGNRYENKEVVVIGGGDGGISEGLYLTRLASKVTVIEILSNLSACRVLQQRALGNPKMKILCSTTVEQIAADGDLKNLGLKNVKTGEKEELKVSGIFVLVGLEPKTEYLKGVVDLDNLGYVVVGNNMETSVPGIFAAGDIRSGSPWQAITAAGDGACASIAAQKFMTLNSL